MDLKLQRIAARGLLPGAVGYTVAALAISLPPSTGDGRMDATANARVIDALYQAYVTGDLAAFDAYTDDSVWHEQGRNERTGVYKGMQAIIEHGMQLAALTDGTIATQVIEILPGDDHVAVLEHATAKRKGRALDMGRCTVYHLHEGKIIAMNVLPFDAAAWDEFWS
jgi:ketosteroid isomerase-like protein